MGLFDNVLLRFSELGVFTVLFPAILIFVLCYAALMRAGIFSGAGNDKGFAALTSLIIAFVLVTQTFLVSWMLTILKGSFLLVIGLMIFLVLGFVNLGIENNRAGITALIAMILGGLALGWPFINRALGGVGLNRILNNPDLWALIILVGVAWFLWKMVSKGKGDTEISVTQTGKPEEQKKG